MVRNINSKNISHLGESLRGNRIGATGLRASERKSASQRVSERVSEREGFQRFLRGFERFLEVFRGFERFSEFFERFSEIFERFSEVFSQTLSEADFLSEALSLLLPLIVLPLELSPNIERHAFSELRNTRPQEMLKFVKQL